MLKKCLLLTLMLPLLALGEVSTTSCTTTLSCNGSTTAFPFGFPIDNTSDLEVTIRVTATGLPIPLVETTDYTVSATNNDYKLEPGGTVTTVSTYASGRTITILRNAPDTQTTTFRGTGPLRSQDWNDALDKLTMLVQQLAETVGRSIKLPVTESSVTTEIDNSVDRAGGYLGFDDSTGDPTILIGVLPDDVAVGVFMETVLPAADAAAVRTLLGITDHPITTAYTEAMLVGANEAEVWAALGIPTISAYAESYFDDVNATDTRGTLAAQRAAWHDVRDYGALGNGVADDASAIQAANDAAELVGGHVYFPEGTYRIATGVTVDASCTWSGRMAILQLDGGDIIVTGAIDNNQAVTAEISRADLELTVADESGFSAGDLLLITGHNDATYTAANQAQWAEYHICRGTDTGKVQLESFVSNRLETTDFPSVKKITPIRVRMEGLIITVNNKANSVFFYLCRDSGLFNCDITGQNSSNNRIVEAKGCLNVTLRDCELYDVVTSTPFRAYGCDGVLVSGNKTRNCYSGPYAAWCKNVTMSGNNVSYTQIQGMLLDRCFNGNISNNTISNMPDTKAHYEAATTSCAGIFLIGGENISISGNSVYASHAEGGIYLRSSTTQYSDTAFQPPLQNVSVVGNVVIDPTEIGTGAANHLAGIFGKVIGSDITIAHNTIDFHSDTAGAGIYMSGQFDRLTIADNVIRSGEGGILIDKNATYESRGCIIRNNDIYLSEDIVGNTYGAIWITEANGAYDHIIEGNKIRGVAQTGTQWHFYVTYASTTWSTGRLWIENNIVEFVSDGAGRGAYTNIIAGTAGQNQVRLWRNDFTHLTGDSVTAVLEPFENNHEQSMEFGRNGVYKGKLVLWDGSGGAAPGYVQIHSPNGTAWYLFVEDDGTFKIVNAAPTQNSDGSAVGDQTD